MMDTYKNIFFIGIKGVAMANLARIFQQMGKTVSGSDVAEEFITDSELQNTNITVINSFDADKLPQNIDLVIYSAAHSGKNNPQVLEAQKRKIAVKHQAEILGELVKEFKTSVAVSGCHGKTTTSSLLSFALINLGVKPSYLVGVSTFNDKFGGEFAEKNYFVVEADEYGLNPPIDKTPKFHFIHATNAIITNIDFDHPDVYKNIEETKDAFRKFIETIPPGNGKIIACADDEDVSSILFSMLPERYISYGISEKSNVQVLEIQPKPTGTSFKIKINKQIVTSTSSPRNDNVMTFEISLFGEKNVLNATSVIIFLLQHGFSAEQIQQAIVTFIGAKRRFELKKQVGETYLFDDYGHHPEEIEATIQAARMRFPDKKIKVIFQPHTYSRTSALENDFVTALSKADEAYLLPVFGSAREVKTETSVESEDLVKAANKKGITTIKSFPSKEELLKNLVINSGDIIFTMGAGDVYKLHSLL